LQDRVIKLRSRVSIAPTVYSYQNAISPTVRRAVYQDLSQIGGWRKAAAGRYADSTLGHGVLDVAIRDVEIRKIDDRCYFDRSSLLEQANIELNEVYGISCEQLSAMTASRYRPGCHIKAHSDADTSVTTRLVTFVLMLSNDATGGELVFPQFSKSHQIKDGEVLMFPSEAVHQVNPVTSGFRVSVIWFAENLI
jgi:hypothetical protein